MTIHSRLKLYATVVLVIGVLFAARILKTPAPIDHYRLRIDGESFLLEVAADKQTRYRGLSGRQYIALSGGMIFVFPKAVPRYFVMRDCLVPIDIVFLDETGAITATYTMLPEEPRLENEASAAYAKRLKRYSSQSPSKYVIEFRAGTINRLGLEQGDRVTLDTRMLQKALR